jgi:hypothetical protein
MVFLPPWARKILESVKFRKTILFYGQLAIQFAVL